MKKYLASSEHYQETGAHLKRRRLDCNILEAVVQSLPRRDWVWGSSCSADLPQPGKCHLITSPSKEPSADGYNRYNTTKYSDPYWKALLAYVNCSHPNVPTMCEIMQSAAESLVHDGKPRKDTNLNAITVCLEAVCLEIRNQMGTSENGNQNGPHPRTKD